MAKFTVREGRREDCLEIRRLIQVTVLSILSVLMFTQAPLRYLTVENESLGRGPYSETFEIERCVSAIFRKELAEYEKMPDGPQITVEDLQRDGFDIHPPLYQTFVAECEDNPHVLVGYAIYYYTYGAWTGRKMYLEDICVTESHRGSGVGYALIRKVIEKGVDVNCLEMDFVVLDWNPAQNFYTKLGATDISKSEGWRLFRMHRPEMVALVSQK